MMYKFILIFALFTLISANEGLINNKRKFQDFVRTYNKHYGTAEETMNRFAIFQDNLKRIDYLSSKNPQAKWGITKFADLTEEEFRRQYKIEDFQSYRNRNTNSAVDIDLPTNMAIPADYDWRDHGAVTPVKNQEQCGSCWAFSATEAIESAWFLAGHTLVSLSPQQIVDCDVGNGDEGCNGGDTTTAYQYVMKAGGMETEDAYPYTGEDGTCRFDKKKTVASIENWAYITKNKNETEMQVGLLSSGPLSICVDAASWQLYVEGVISSTEICGDSLDHCVMITGFQNYDDGIWGTYAVWNVRNSWGADWGMSGYILVERGYDICGVADEVTVPLIN